MAVQWERSMSTGVAGLDAQHQEIIRRLNELMGAMAQGRERQELGGLLTFLRQYVQEHFSQEEEVMAQYRCPVAEANRKAHSRYSRNLAFVQEQFEREGVSSALALKIQRDLADWIVNHIRRIDAQLYAAVQKALH
jgi:hemerythrin